MCTIAIDYDGTISFDFNKARKAISTLMKEGHYIIIWSSRNNSRQHPERSEALMKEMKEALQLHQVPFHEIDDGSVGKFHAQVYIDDKALTFQDNWDELIERIY